MKYLLLSSLPLLAVPSLSPGDALADAARDAREDIADAIDSAADDTRRCERRVTPILEDVQRALRPRRITRLRARRALDDLDDARDAARTCGRRVRRLLRSASRALESIADRDRRDRRDRVRPVPRKKLAPVPDNSWSRDCKTQWYMIEMIDMAGAKAAHRAAVAQIGNVACGNQRLGELTWPNGNTARFADGTWRYPNGNTARFADGTLRYPNGNTAKFADGTWRFPNGHRAGSWQSVESFACGKSKDRCKLYRERKRSSDPIFRELLLVREAWQAHRGR